VKSEEPATWYHPKPALSKPPLRMSSTQFDACWALVVKRDRVRLSAATVLGNAVEEVIRSNIATAKARATLLRKRGEKHECGNNTRQALFES
jgi:hypothetical protein